MTEEKQDNWKWDATKNETSLKMTEVKQDNWKWDTTKNETQLKWLILKKTNLKWTTLEQDILKEETNFKIRQISELA